VNIGRGGVTRIDIPLVSLLQGKSRSRVVHKQPMQVTELRMSGCSLMSMGDSKDGYNCSRYGGCSYGGSGKEAEEFIMSSGEYDDRCEQWFKRENSQVEQRSLLRLERELEAMICFEHGDGKEGGPRAIPIWVMCIMLGRLFREWQALGHVVKLYSHFQH
jgi:hypothetical protein